MSYFKPEAGPVVLGQTDRLTLFQSKLRESSHSVLKLQSLVRREKHLDLSLQPKSKKTRHAKRKWWGCVPLLRAATILPAKSRRPVQLLYLLSQVHLRSFEGNNLNLEASNSDTS